MNKFFLPPKLQWITINSPEFVLGHYIYEWRDCNQVFYVGMGTNRRAWNQHLPLPQERREAATNFKVNIYRDGLTKAQAHLLERHLTIRYLNLGFELLNERISNNVGSYAERKRIAYLHNLIRRKD